MPKTKAIKLFILLMVFFISLSFLILPNPVKAEDYDENLKWNASECFEKCVQIKDEIVDKLADRILELEDESAIRDIEATILRVDAWDCAQDQTGMDVYCYAPPMATTLQVPIGETHTVFGLVDYIVKFFEWGTRAIAIIAVVMIMFAGIQWLSAAGNSGAIDKAKNQIKNSVIGLVLVLCGVFLLNLINPALTDLKGLEIKMVPTFLQGRLWCKDMKVPEGAMFKEKDGKKGASINEENNTVGECGKEYVIPTSEDQTCKGDGCPSNELCMISNVDKRTFMCTESYFGGNIDCNRTKCIDAIRLYPIYQNVTESARGYVEIVKVGDCFSKIIIAGLEEKIGELNTDEKDRSYAFTPDEIGGDSWGYIKEDIPFVTKTWGDIGLGAIVTPLIGKAFNVKLVGFILEIEAKGFWNDNWRAVGHLGSNPVPLSGLAKPFKDYTVAELTHAMNNKQFLPAEEVYRALKGEKAYRFDLKLGNLNNWR